MGITTLEEVFLRIAKGDSEDEFERESLRNSVVSKNSGSSAVEDYSIADEQYSGRCNVFWY